jgi:alpha-L-fucosidase
MRAGILQIIHGRRFLLLLVVLAIEGCQELRPGPVAVIRTGDTPEEIVWKAANVCPSLRQKQWQEREFITFFHFGINTFTDREWGTGTESPSLFNPTDFDARQWARVARDAGMRMAIITAKHHDGFCLWPSAFTEHSVKNSPWRNGKGDVVGDLAAACKEFGLAFGLYLSPWDRHEPTYGDSPRYNEYFRNQLRELLSNYGDVAEVWFDGACGEGPNGRRQEYDWPSYYRIIRELQPGAVIFGMGPDVRWVGTESGYGRETEWSVIPDVLQSPDPVAVRHRQEAVDRAFLPRDLTHHDLGSREKILASRSLAWYPAETDVSIRPGWFHHPGEDNRVKTPEQLVDIYYASVGRNGVLLLNIPPDTRGRIHDNDIRSLVGMRRILEHTFRIDLASSATVTASSEKPAHRASSVIDRDPATYWTTQNGATQAELTFELPGEPVFDCVMLQEYISVGQRVEKFRLECWDGRVWNPVAEGTTVGYKRLLRFPPVKMEKIRLRIEQSRAAPALSTVGLFTTPPGGSAE